MNFKYYSSWFHDGRLKFITHTKEHTDFGVSTSEIMSEENIDNLKLKELSTSPDPNDPPFYVLVGVIRLSGIQEILVGHDPVSQIGEFDEDNPSTAQGGMFDYDKGEILDLDVSQNYLKLLVEWRNYPPRPLLEKSECSLIEITADKIEWIDELNDIRIELPD